MGRLCFVSACFTITLIFSAQAMAVRSGGSELVPIRLAIANPPSSAESSTVEGQDERHVAEAPEIRRMGKHHSTDKSVAGGGVIIGGLVTAIFAAVYCYIRVTQKAAAREEEK